MSSCLSCARSQTDLDLGSSGAIVIKDKYIITGGKQGPLYIADTANLGGYQPNANNTNVFEVLSWNMQSLHVLPWHTCCMCCN